MNPFDYESSPVTNKFLVLDLEEDERQFKAKLPEFWKNVSCANKKTKRGEGEPPSFVELGIVEASYCDDSANEPQEPQEPSMSHLQNQDDPLSDLFEQPPSNKIPCQTQSSLDDIFEFFPNGTTSSGTAELLVHSNAVPEIHASTKSEDVVPSQDDFVPSELPVKPKITVESSRDEATDNFLAGIVPVPENTNDKELKVTDDDVKGAIDPKPNVSKSVALPEITPWDTSLTNALVNFDIEGFQTVVAHVNKSMANVDRTLDLEVAEKQLDEYRVDLELEDSDRLGMLGDKMAEVQAMMDSIKKVLLRLTSWGNAVEKSWKYVETVGLLYASASNREKREAQVKLALSDFWLEYTVVTRIRDSYNDQLETLKSQWDTLSRLITHDMGVRNTIRNLSAGELSEPEKASIAEFVSNELTKQLPEILKSQHKINSQDIKHDKENDVQPQRVDIFEKEPVSDPLKFANLDEFPKNAASIMDPKQKNKKGEVGWNF